MKTLFPLLPQTPSSGLRVFIRKTILNDIKTANLRTKNHKLNNAVQAMLFGMIERGLGAEVTGDKGKTKVAAPGTRANSDEAMWAIILAKELWRKNIWRDAKTVAIIAQGCFHPVIKAQSASLHFFLGDEEDVEDSYGSNKALGDAAFSCHRHFASHVRGPSVPPRLLVSGFAILILSKSHCH